MAPRMNNQPKNETAATPSQPEPENLLAGRTSAGRGIRARSSKAVMVGLHCGDSGSTPDAHTIPADSEASLSEWYDWVERNQLQNEREAQEREWARQVQLQEETDDGYEEFGFKHEPL